jgi:phosphatidylglycerophosphate synthase
MTPTGDRRPIAARNLAITQRFADWLIARRASADGISVAGMVAGLLAGLCFAATAWTDADRALWLLGAVLVQLRLLANMMDGMVAVGRGIASPKGELFNEVPDRISDTAVLFGLGVAIASPAWGLAAGMAAMATAYIRAVGKAAGAPSDFRGPMAKQQRMFIATALGVWCAVVPPDWRAPDWRVDVVWWALVAITLLSAVTALRRLSHSAAALEAK